MTVSKSDCFQVQTATLRWMIGGLLTGLAMLASILWALAMNYSQTKQSRADMLDMMNMHHVAIREIAKGCCPPDVRQSVSDIFFNAARASEKATQ